MKNIITYIFVFVLFCYKLGAETFFVFIDDNKTINILNDQNVSYGDNLNNFLTWLKTGDTIAFRRGDKFYTYFDISNEKNITIKSYGEENLSFPVIDSRTKIIFDDQNDSSAVYPKNGDEAWNDESWNNLAAVFESKFDALASYTKNGRKKFFSEVKDKIYEIVRIKLPLYKFKGFDHTALRVWIGDEEILRVLYFEELNCDECKYKIRWYYEKESGYLYIFSSSSDTELKDELSNIFINNSNYYTVKLSDSSNITIENLDIRGGKYALAIKGSKDITVKNSVIGKGAFTGIYVTNEFENYVNGSKNVTIEGCMIESDFRFDYRFFSVRGSQDGIFFLNHVTDSVVKNSKIYDWGHTGINLASSNENNVSGNKIYHNTFDGKNIPYMRALAFDGNGTYDNVFSQNVIRHMKVRSQINGISNTVKYNIVYDIQNSQIKMDQGYGSGQAFQLEAYGGGNVSAENIIEKNLIMKVDEAGISIDGRTGYGDKFDNNISDNILIDCGNRIFETYEKDYNQSAIEIIDFDKDDLSIKGNNFISNKIYTPYSLAYVYYRGELLWVDDFNKKDGSNDDTIRDNLLFTNIDISNIYTINYDSDNFVLTDSYLYIYRFYLNIFKRTPDFGGLSYWVNKIRKIDDNTSSADSTVTAAETAKYFFQSGELKAANLTDEEFITRAYNTLLNRKPDAGGFNYWLDRIQKKGIKRDVIFYGFVFSKEFEELGKKYNIVPFDSKDKLTAFVERMYLLVLERDFDPSGREYWVDALQSGQKSASSLTRYFFLSKEFTDKDVTNEHFIELAYWAVLDRDPDENGKNYWLNELKNSSREEILMKFLNSDEFKNLASSYGIVNI